MLARRLLAVPAALLLAQLAMADEDWTTFEFQAYNREYVDIRTNTKWERGGPMQATLTSPAHRLSVRDHTVDLRPGPNGAYHARVRVNFSGDGDVIAELGMAGAGTQLEDHVTAPQQEIEVIALLRFRQVEGGYEIETLEMQESVEVEIESRLGGQIVAICSSALAFLGVDCTGARAMFSTASIKMPAAGATYFISADRLSEAERSRLDRFLEQGE